MSNPFKNQVVKTTKTLKTFTYQKGKVRLEFTLDINSKADMKDFRECLDDARDDLINQESE